MSLFFESNGARLGFSDTGAGLPLVFLHPTPLDRAYWLPLIDNLAGVRAIVPDLRGHGSSELGELPAGGFSLVPDAPLLTMAQLSEDVIALLNHLGIAEAVFVGCSIGGYVLLDLWRKAPERVKALAFVCSKPQPDTEANLSRRAATIALGRSGGIESLFDAMTQALIGATTRARNPEIIPAVRARMTLTPEALAAVQAGLATRPNSLPTVATIHVPTLVIAGGEDSTSTPAEMEAFRTAPGGCEFHLLPDAGHFAAYEQSEKVATLIADWLRQLEL